MKIVNTPDSIEITDTETGEIKTIKLATEKQIRYIRVLEQQTGTKPKKYTNLTIWQAVKVIEKLKSKQTRLL